METSDPMNSAAELAVLQDTCRALIRVRSEATTASLASLAVRRYATLAAPERDAFFHFLLTEFSPDPSRIEQAISTYGDDPGPKTAQHLADAAEAPRRELFRQMNTAPGGTACILTMRADCIVARRGHSDLGPVEHDLAAALTSWFNRGFLQLEHIDWETPASVLEKLIEYEAVHEIRGWDDLRRRLETDRRCFGFFHPSLPGEPLIFVEVALTVGLQTSIQAVIDAPPPTEAALEKTDTAIFYSITNCQPGLQGIPLGSFLLKQVTDELAATVPGIDTFSTLSPVPGYVEWVRSTGGWLEPAVAAIVTSGPPMIDPSLEAAVLGSCARYLVHAKRRHLPLDPVARFHLRNGAHLEQINFRGDTSAKGIGESYGVLVNYVYDLDDLSDNHEAFMNEHRVVHSKRVAQLASGS